MALTSLNRFQASATHLIFSVLVALLSAALVFLLWYPNPFSYASGVERIFLLLLVVDVVLGPIVTLVVFNPVKKELKRDLLIVVFIQASALLYGMYSVFIARPVYMVFSVDRFEVVYANDISEDDLAKVENPIYRHLPMLGVLTTAARLPSDSEARNAILLSAVSGGSDVQHMPQYYVSYSEMQSIAVARIQPLSNLHSFNPDKSMVVDTLVKKYSESRIEVGFLPLQAKSHDLAVVLDKRTGTVLEIVKLSPWSN